MNNQQEDNGMATRIERINPYLNVRNISTGLDYYVNVLGFYRYIETPNLAILERNGHQIHLTASTEEITAHKVWIGVEDIAELFEQYREKGARFHQEPTNFSWAYQMIIEDLDGNLLIFGSAPLEDQPFQDEMIEP